MKKKYQRKDHKSDRKSEIVRGQELLVRVPLPLPMAEVWAEMQAHVEELTGQAGLQILRAILENEVTRRVGPPHRPNPNAGCVRWGNQPGYAVLQHRVVSTAIRISATVRPRMDAKAITPILNVSDMAASFAWFEKWGWKKLWDWGSPPTFGAVGSGECEIFLCWGAQGGRGRGANTTTFSVDGDEAEDKGAWMSLWVDDVDEVHQHCVAAGLDVTFPPTNMPWNVREMHLRHPDGHVFRVSRGVGQ